MKLSRKLATTVLICAIGLLIDFPRTCLADETNLEELKSAAQQGDPHSQFELAVMYHDGEGVQKNFAEALKWVRKAAEQGHAKAQFLLGVSYVKGEGVQKDNAEAVKWYHKAAERGHPDARFNLGVSYFMGQGVPRNSVEAYKWFNLAVASGNAAATEARSKVERELTAGQIAEAKRLSHKNQGTVRRNILYERPKLHV